MKSQHERNGIREYKYQSSTFICEKNTIESYLCTKCEYSSELKTQLKHHINRKHSQQEEKRHECGHCPFKTETLMLLLKHQITHLLDDLNYETKTEEELPVMKRVCEYCSFETFSCIVYLNHTANCFYKPFKSKGMKWYRCDKCDYKSKISAKLEQHRSRKHCLTCYRCELCFYKCVSAFGLWMHKRKMHITPQGKKRIRDKKWRRCTMCPYMCKTSKCFRNHTRRFHPTFNKTKESNCCQHCDFKGTTLILQKHNRNVHNIDGVRRFKCKDCDYTSIHRPNVVRHYKRKHVPVKGIKWFQCDECEYKAKVKYNLTDHVARKHEIVGDESRKRREKNPEVK